MRTITKTFEWLCDRLPHTMVKNSIKDFRDFYLIMLKLLIFQKCQMNFLRIGFFLYLLRTKVILFFYWFAKHWFDQHFITKFPPYIIYFVDNSVDFIDKVAVIENCLHFVDLSLVFGIFQCRFIYVSFFTAGLCIFTLCLNILIFIGSSFQTVASVNAYTPNLPVLCFPVRLPFDKALKNVFILVLRIAAMKLPTDSGNQ